MSKFIIIKTMPLTAHEDHVYLRWDSTSLSPPFNYPHLDDYKTAKKYCDKPYLYPIKKEDYLPAMKVDKWNNLQANYMEDSK